MGNLVKNAQEAESERIQSPVKGTVQNVEERKSQHAECGVALGPCWVQQELETAHTKDGSPAKRR